MGIFKKATRENKPWRLLLRGVSGSGKTHSALIIANELKGDGRICVIDTEKMSSAHLADKFDFDAVDFGEYSEVHNPKKYIELIEAAEKEGYTVVVIDSFSHAWNGKGG